MNWIDERLDTLRRIKETLDMQSGVSTKQGSLYLSEINLLETLKEAREALENYINAKPQCECSPGSGCRMAAAKEQAKRVVEQIDALGK